MLMFSLQPSRHPCMHCPFVNPFLCDVVCLHSVEVFQSNLALVIILRGAIAEKVFKVAGRSNVLLWQRLVQGMWVSWLYSEAVFDTIDDVDQGSVIFCVNTFKPQVYYKW